MQPAVGPAFEIGALIADTYRIERELGRGGMGIVLLATHTRLPDKHVAIKVLHAQLAKDELLARFKREAHIVSVLAHPNIVHVEDYNVTPDGTPYLVLEYLPGESLAERLARGPLELDLALSIARQIGSALSAAHARHIVHRDLKPQNVFLVPTDDTVVAKVLDFGISKMLDSDTVKTDNDALLGTPQYMAPEQATGQSDLIGVRTDVFSLGAIVYEMLSGKPAFAGTTLPEVVFKAVYEQPPALPASIPAPVASAVRQAMAKAPAERFGTVSGFIESLTGRRISSPTNPLVISDSSPRVDELAQTIDSANVPHGALTATVNEAKAPRRTALRYWPIAAAVAVIAIVVGILFATHHSSAPSQRLGPKRQREVATQLLAGRTDVVLDGRRYTIEMTDNDLHKVMFEVGAHPYEAIEQNPAKKSRWAQLAREGHRVVQFKDLATDRYIGVTVDGEPRRYSEGVPDER